MNLIKLRNLRRVITDDRNKAARESSYDAYTMTLFSAVLNDAPLVHGTEALTVITVAKYVSVAQQYG